MPLAALLGEAAAQSAAAQALYGRMRVLGEANAGSAAAQPAEFDESLLAGAADALFGASALPQVYALWARDGSFQALEDAGPTQGHALVDEFGFFSLSHRALSATYAPGNSAVVAFCAAFTHEAAGLPAGVDWEACARRAAAAQRGGHTLRGVSGGAGLAPVRHLPARRGAQPFARLRPGIFGRSGLKNGCIPTPS